MTSVQIFLSAVTEEFGSYRDALRAKLQRPNVTVHVQEDFIATGTETLDKLESYIRDCDAVIHLVGKRTGSFPPIRAMLGLEERCPTLRKHLPMLAPSIDTGTPAISYTQWEAYLALLHKKMLVIAAASADAPRDRTFAVDEAQGLAQEAHLDRLRQVDRHPEIRFQSVDQLIANVSHSTVLDLLVRAGGGRQRRLLDAVYRGVVLAGHAIRGLLLSLLIVTLGIALHRVIVGRSISESIGTAGTVWLHVIALLVGTGGGLMYGLREGRRTPLR